MIYVDNSLTHFPEFEAFREYFAIFEYFDNTLKHVEVTERSFRFAALAVKLPYMLGDLFYALFEL